MLLLRQLAARGARRFSTILQACGGGRRDGINMMVVAEEIRHRPVGSGGEGVAPTTREKDGGGGCDGDEDDDELQSGPSFARVSTR